MMIIYDTTFIPSKREERSVQTRPARPSLDLRKTKARHKQEENSQTPLLLTFAKQHACVYKTLTLFCVFDCGVSPKLRRLEG